MANLTAKQEALNYYVDHPVEFVEDVIGAHPDEAQARILNSVRDNRKTTVRSGHGVGKTTVEAWVILWYLYTRPFATIACTAPTQHQLYDVLWKEISNWLHRSPILEKDIVWSKQKVCVRGYADRWFAIARTASKPEGMQGFHGANMLFIIDEASGIDDELYEVILGALSTEGAKLLMCANPTQLSGFFYDSHHKSAGEYECIRIDGRNSPHTSKEFIDNIINEFGEDSDVFRVRVAGEFPLAEEDIFISLPLLESSLQAGLDYKLPSNPQSIHIGADIARYGDDETVIGWRIDKRVFLQDDALFIPRTRRKGFNGVARGQNTMATADKIVSLGEALVAKYGLRQGVDEPIPVKIDDGGVGGGVVDRLEQIKNGDPARYWWMRILRVHFGARIAKHKYCHDTTSHMMWILKKLLTPYEIVDGKEVAKPIEVILPDDNALIAQLSTRHYQVTENGKIRIESKDMVKKRGQTSPDRADCVLLCCLPVEPARRKGGAMIA